MSIRVFVLAAIVAIVAMLAVITMTASAGGCWSLTMGDTNSPNWQCGTPAPDLPTGTLTTAPDNYRKVATFKVQGKTPTTEFVVNGECLMLTAKQFYTVDCDTLNAWFNQVQPMIVP